MAINAMQWRDLMLLRMQQVEQFQRFQMQQQQMMPGMQLQQQDDNEEEDSCPEELRTLFIANLDDTKVDEELLYELFLQAGPIEKISFPKKKTFAFITYVHSCSPAYAMHIYQGVKLFGTPLVIKFKGTTNLPPLTRRILPPDFGIVSDHLAMPTHNPFSEPSRSQGRSFDNAALRNSRYAAFMDTHHDDKNHRRERSPSKRYSRERSNDIHRRHDRSPTRRRQDKDSELNWTHGPDRTRSRSHHSLQYAKRRY